jgi:hypothetical protein
LYVVLELGERPGVAGESCEVSEMWERPEDARLRRIPGVLGVGSWNLADFVDCCFTRGLVKGEERVGSVGSLNSLSWVCGGGAGKESAKGRLELEKEGPEGEIGVGV